jgi:hypothetical protein
MIRDLVSLFKSLADKDFDKVGENLKKFFTDWSDGMKSTFTSSTGIVGGITEAVTGQKQTGAEVASFVCIARSYGFSG